jgi:hypothetical protein
MRFDFFVTVYFVQVTGTCSSKCSKNSNLAAIPLFFLLNDYIYGIFFSVAKQVINIIPYSLLSPL